MKKIYLIASTIAAFAFSLEVKSQQLFTCGQVEAEQQLKADPVMRNLIKAAEEKQARWIQDFTDTPTESRSADYIIPVVFHIIHNFGAENISDAQVHDMMRILNEDFQKLNADTANVVSAFKSIVGNAKMEFRLAQKDPQGNCTKGIIRVASLETYKGNNYFSNTSTSSLSRWPRNQYLNIWVVAKIESGAAGYTYRPQAVSSAPALDGIMILHNYVGGIGTGSYSRSRALTHEIGHWLDLPHTWGGTNNPGLASNCDDDDGIADTPNTIGVRSCNLSHNSCGTLDNVQNYMDYSYCYAMFTQGQATRMRAAITSSVAQRSSLWQQSNLNNTGVLNQGVICKADFANDRRDICAGQSVNFTDNSFNSPNQWAWTFSGGSPTSSTQNNPTVTYQTPGVYNVQLIASNNSGSKTETKSGLIHVLSNNGKPGPFSESFENFAAASNDYFIHNPDGGATWQLANVGATGSRSLMINNLVNIEQRDDEFISSTVDLSGFNAVSISFKVAYAQRSSTDNDALRFFATNNCGQTWSQRWVRTGKDLSSITGTRSSAFTPTADEWKEFVITTMPASFLKSNFRFKFTFTSGKGNNVYIDDINIFDPTALSVEQLPVNLNELNVYPNPFKGESVVEFSLIQPERVIMTITDMLGKEISLLKGSQLLPAGSHSFRISKSEIGLTPGLYFLKVGTGANQSVKKIIVQ
jgi:PKD repeat protein